MECIQNEKSLNTNINKLNWRLNYMFSDHKPGLLLYAILPNPAFRSQSLYVCVLVVLFLYYFYIF